MDYSTLRQEILSDLKQNIKVNTNLKILRQKINSRQATYLDAGNFSKVFGDAVSESIARHTYEGVEDEFLKEFADECLAPIYRECQNTMIAAGTAIQKGLNDNAGINLKPAEVVRDESRISNLVQRFAEATSYDEVSFLTNKNTAESITRGSVNDCIRTNSKAQSDAGLKVLLTRSDGSGCCDWCSSVTGTFKSFDALPDGFWGIHRGCGCTIDYHVGKTNTRLSYTTNEKGKITKNNEQI